MNADAGIAEFTAGLELHQLVPAVVYSLGHPDISDILHPKPLTDISPQDLAIRHINPANELLVDQSLIPTSSRLLRTKLSLSVKKPFGQNLEKILSPQDETTIRKGVLNYYVGKESLSKIDNPLLPYYREASDDLEQLAEMIEIQGEDTYFEQQSDPAGMGITYRCLTGLPVYTPRIIQTSDEKPLTEFVLPVENIKKWKERGDSGFYPEKTSGIRGMDERSHLIVHNQKMVSQMTRFIRNTPSLLKLFLAEEIALAQENLIHNLRGKFISISKDKFPVLEKRMDTMNNTLRVAVYDHFTQLLETDDMLFISLVPHVPVNDYVPVIYEVNKNDDGLTFRNAGEGYGDIYVKKSGDGKSLFFKDSHSSNTEWFGIRHQGDLQSSSVLHLFQSIQFLPQKQFERMDQMTLSDEMIRLHYLTARDMTSKEFFYQFNAMGLLNWDPVEEMTLKSRRNIIVSTEPFHSLPINKRKG